MRSVISILLLSALFYHGHSLEFKDPANGIITFGDVEDGVQILSMDENEGSTVAVTVVLVSGAAIKPTLTFSDGDETLFGPSVEEAGADWAIVATIPIDYEQLSSHRFLVDVSDGTTPLTFNLLINNVDDEPPTLQTANCKMDESTPIDTFNSECIFSVSDPDGFLNEMTFTVKNSNQGVEDTLFAFAFNEEPSATAKEADVYLILQPDKKLDFETNTLYIFQVAAKDGAGHESTPQPNVQIVVQVNDIPDEKPVWNVFVSMTTFVEEQPTDISVEAKDGDFGVNADINYQLTPESELITINPETGLISIGKIDRDDGIHGDPIKVTVTAFEVPDPESSISGEITFIISDIDDNKPVISIPGSTDEKLIIQIDEQTVDPLPTIININDIDTGANAMYSVELVDLDGKDYTSAFQVIPSRGFSSSNFSINIIDPSKLDYENPDWRLIQFNMVATGDVTPENTNTFSITINLIDKNDESPVFENEGEFTVQIPESIAMGVLVETIKATDADAGDTVSHSLMGTLANNLLTIDSTTAEIRTKLDRSFDYERQNEIFVQILAKDAADPSHTTVAQLTIQVMDVNDEDPTIVVSSTASLEENQPTGTEVDILISASDEDISANLSFTINWDESYAIKNSIKLTPEEFAPYHCIDVETVTDPDDNKKATAKLTVLETQPGDTPNFEKYDSLFLKLEVKDQATEVEGPRFGKDSAIIVINIENQNDVPPVFPDDIIKAKRYVTENSAVDLPIGPATAVDEDNLGDLEYSLSTTDDAIADWIKIDPTTGALSVNFNGIDCDDPKRDDITYTVTVTDQVHTATLDVVITILDQNENPPSMEAVVVEIPENTSPGAILDLTYTDKDRDEDFNKVSCLIPDDAGTNIHNNFRIENMQLLVQDTAHLDYDSAENSFIFSIKCKDNPTNQGPIQNEITVPVTITLTDVNDLTPEIVTTEITASVTENAKAGTSFPDAITAEDGDGPGPFSQIDFKILTIEGYRDASYENPIEDLPADMFDVQTDADHESQKASLIVNVDLKDWYGFYILTIRTNDFAEDGTEQNVKDDNKVYLTVDKWNFVEPEFIFPDSSGLHFILSTIQDINSRLIEYDNSTWFPNFQATDNQNNKYDIEFSISGLDDDIFKIDNSDSFGVSQSQLQLKNTDFVPNKSYKATITASIGPSESQRDGEAPYTKDITANFSFFDTSANPTFDYPSASFQLDENDLEMKQGIEPATYNVDGVELPIFYFLSRASDIFKVDAGSGEISLQQVLDYETAKSHVINIQACRTNSPDPTPDPGTEVEITINVNPVNDNSPAFDTPNYYGGIKTTYPTDTKIVTASATDADLDVGNELTFSIDAASLVKNGSNLNPVTDPFVINNDGDVRLAFTVQPNMAGYFTFNVIVTDPAPESHTATCLVTIFIVTDDNLVNFKFENTIDKVQEKTTRIKEILDDEFGYISTMETPKADASESGASLDNQTIVPVYFIDPDTNVPFNHDVILEKITDIKVFARLRETFLGDSLILMSFDGESQAEENQEEMLRAWLIGVSVVLGALCLILLVAFILRTRALNQRINNLSSTKFGSQESGLNRLGVAAPTTNKHALEGSNPVYNNDIDTKEVDHVSTASGDSDLIGVEDNPEFEYDNNSYEDFNKDEFID